MYCRVRSDGVLHAIKNRGLAMELDLPTEPLELLSRGAVG